MRLAALTIVTLALAGIGADVNAQTGFTRTILQQGDISAPGREIVTASVEFQPGARSDGTSHPGEEVGYIVEGTFVVEQDGKPAVTLGAGKAFLIPTGVIHNATNTGSGYRPRPSHLHRRKGRSLSRYARPCQVARFMTIGNGRCDKWLPTTSSGMTFHRP